jgi:hypothetical protein
LAADSLTQPIAFSLATRQAIKDIADHRNPHAPDIVDRRSAVTVAGATALIETPENDFEKCRLFPVDRGN